MSRRPPPEDRDALAGARAGEAINLQLYRRLVSLIATGRWSAGSRLPSSRKLAADTAVSRTTASLALDRLVADGWAVARPRSGLFVAASGRPSRGGEGTGQPGTPPVPFELSQGAVDCFPHARWSKLQSRVWASEVPGALYEPQIAGDPGLRSSIARHLMVNRGVDCSAEDVLIVASTRAALALVAAMLAGEVASAAVEDPGYWRGAEALSVAGLRTVPAAVDRDGLRIEALGQSAGERRPMLVYTTPAAQFPTGVVMADERRRELANWCVEGGHWLFEDDYDWDAQFALARAPAPLRAGAAAERTFYCQSLSRTMFPSFRMAALVVPPALRERAAIALDRVEGSSNSTGQLVLREFIDCGGYAAHLRQLREVYAARREALLDIVRPYLGKLFEREVNSAGLRLVLRCGPAEAARLAGRLREEGILCSTLSELSSDGVADDGIVLGFAAFPVDAIAACREPIARAFPELAS